jgi:GxxExxY protein
MSHRGTKAESKGNLLEIAGVKLQKQAIFPMPYRDRLISQRRLDSLIEDKVAIEPRRKERFDAGFEAQILTYLKLPGLKAYLLTNFNSGLGKNGIRRFIL